MCFGHKPAPTSVPICISAPTSLPFDYEKHPLAPWQNAYSTHAIHPVPAPPPKRAVTRSTYAPRPVPVFDREWRERPLSVRQQKVQVEEERRGRESLGLGPDGGRRWWGWGWGFGGVARGRWRVLRNVGVNEGGRLKGEWEAVGGREWWDEEEGEQEEGRKYRMW
ncbi:hypothetical protein MMC34_006014 [Xylographa carneopallida]|nr:hypothetical protein [Xylographa carneopallida]